MTEGAERFIGCDHAVGARQRARPDRLWDDPETPIPHTELGQGADLILVARRPHGLIAAYRMGLSTDLLTNVLLATRAPVMICPAMHTEMWEHPAVVDNIATLRRRGVSTSSSPNAVGWPAATSVPVGWRRPNRSSPPSSGCSRPAISPVPGWSSAPAAPASRSTPCG